MSKQAIALLQAERDHIASAGLDFGGRLSDEDSSTVAEYDDAIAAVQKLMDSHADDLKAYELLFKENAALKRDAERYRFLKMHDDFAACEWRKEPHETYANWWSITNDELDAAMSAAIGYTEAA